MRIQRFIVSLIISLFTITDSKSEVIYVTLDNQDVIECRDLDQDQYLLECEYESHRALLSFTMFGRRLFVLNDDGRNIETRNILEIKNKEDEILFMSSMSASDEAEPETVLEEIYSKTIDYDSIASLQYVIETYSPLVSEVLNRLKAEVESSISSLEQDQIALKLSSEESIDCQRINKSHSSTSSNCSFLACPNHQVLYFPNAEFTFHPALFSPHSSQPLRPLSFSEARAHHSGKVLYRNKTVKGHEPLNADSEEDQDNSDFLSSFLNFRPRHFSLDDFIPQNLMEENSPFQGHPNDLSRLHEFEAAIEQCASHPSLNTLKAQIQNFRDELASAQVTQYVYDMVDILGSSYLASHALPPGGCYHEGIYYDPNAFTRAREYFTDNDPRTTTLEQAQTLFNLAQNMDDIAWNYRQDGCYARAHLMARRFEEMGFHVDKIWIKGDLQVNFDDGETINWNFHVAPVVYIPREDGSSQAYVIDPSIMSEPVPMDQWMQRMTSSQRHSPRESSFPFPDNASVYGRSSYVITNSDPYLPDDIDTMSEDQKMSEAIDTMQAYRGLNP